MYKLPKWKLAKNLKKELYRKSIHLSSLWIPLFIYFVHPGVSIVFFSLLFVGNVLIEYGNYKKYPWARRTFGSLFFRMLRNKETTHGKFQVSGSLYVLLAAIACTLLFPQPVAVISLSVMLISDTSAALFGKAYGTRKLYKNKSLEGTVAFFLSALIVNMLCEPIYHFTYAGVIACAAASFAEMFEDKLEVDDNLSIPLVVGTVLVILN
jgi:cytidylyltransferase family